MVLSLHSCYYKWAYCSFSLTTTTVTATDNTSITINNNYYYFHYNGTYWCSDKFVNLYSGGQNAAYAD
jgi:hypothetical protein